MRPCQSGVWAKSASSGDSGGYTFQITGYVGDFYGTGNYNNSTGKFTGNLICNAVNDYCGTKSFRWCGSDSNLAWNAARQTFGNRIAGVSNLPVDTVVRLW